MSYRRESRAYWREWIAWEKGVRLSCREETAPDGQAEDREPAEASGEAVLVAEENVCHN